MGAFNIYKQSIFIISVMLVYAGCNSQTKTDGEKSGILPDQKWQIIGPGGGGGVLKPTVSPFDENFVMTHCDMTAAYVSHDGGMNWNEKNLYNVPEDFEFDPVDPNTVYIATKGFLHSDDRGSGISFLLRSDDRGEKWKIIFPDVSKSKKVEFLQSTSLVPSEIIPGALDGTIQKVKVDPENNKTIFLGLAPLVDYMARENTGNDKKMARLVVTEDRGQTWKVVGTLNGKNIMAIFPDNKSDLVIVFTESSCQQVNQLTGETVDLPLPVKSLIAVEGGTGKSGSLIYIQSQFGRRGGDVTGGMYISNDKGKSWKQINKGLLDGVAKGRVPNFRQGLAVCSLQPEVAYISTINPVTQKDGKTEEIYSIYKTENSGNTWTPVLLSSSPSGYISKNFSGSWMEKSFDPGWGGAPIDLGVAPGNPNVCYAGDNGRGYKTSDGGKTWEQIYSHNNPDGSYSNTGLNVTTCYGVHFDPFDKNHYFICYTDMGLFHTFNGGKSWFHSITNIPGDWTNTCYDLTFDPDVKGKVWSAWANAHDLPRTKMFGGPGFGRFEGGVAISSDGGLTWQKSNTGIPENAICTNIYVDPASPFDSRVLYVSVFDKGVYKSIDGGKSWKAANKGLGNNLFAWELRQNSLGRLFVLFARGEKSNNVVDGSIYFSDDKAESWVKLKLPEGVNGPHDLLINPENPEIMYVSCWPQTVDGNDKFGGMIKTSDGGKTWKQVFDERIRVNSAGLDPAHPEKVYFNTFQNAAYRSENNGDSWTRIGGYRFKWGQKAVVDINNQGMLFLTTYGSSVFYGPADFSPEKEDDIMNMPKGWW